jgi:hypothetical protein
MQRLLIIPVLFLTLMVGNDAWGEWKYVSSDDGDKYFVDFTRIIQNEEYVYYWNLLNRGEPSKSGVLSTKLYQKGDCKLFRFQVLSFTFYKESMGKGTPQSFTPKNKSWTNPPPTSNGDVVLKSVCNYVKNR